LVVMVTSVDPSAFPSFLVAFPDEGRAGRPPNTPEGPAYVSLGRESMSAACACTHDVRDRGGWRRNDEGVPVLGLLLGRLQRFR